MVSRWNSNYSTMCPFNWRLLPKLRRRKWLLISGTISQFSSIYNILLLNFNLFWFFLIYRTLNIYHSHRHLRIRTQNRPRAAELLQRWLWTLGRFSAVFPSTIPHFSLVETSTASSFHCWKINQTLFPLVRLYESTKTSRAAVRDWWPSQCARKQNLRRPFFVVSTLCKHGCGPDLINIIWTFFMVFF